LNFCGLVPPYRFHSTMDWTSPNSFDTGVNSFGFVPVLPDFTTPQVLLPAKFENNIADVNWLVRDDLPDSCVLGEGSYGRVLRAKDVRSGQPRALKLVAATVAEREVKITKHLKLHVHPHVLKFMNVVCLGSEWTLLVMELCSFGDVLMDVSLRRERASQQGIGYVPSPLHPLWMGQTFLALEFLHKDARILHLDIKPANVLLASSNHVKLADFGKSMSIEEACFIDNVGKAGSPGYVAPEILMRTRCDAKSDWYSYAVLLWLVLTGGLSQHSEPQPPTEVRRMSMADFELGNFSVLFDDWRNLAALVSDGNSCLAPALLGDAQSLVLATLRQNPEERLGACGIRAHPYMVGIGLPQAGADAQSLQQWNDDTAARF